MLATSIVYASGNLGKSLIGSFINIFALFYLTDVLGISPALAGLILLVSLVWDGLTDPIMGLIADRLRETLNSIRVFFYVGAPVTALSFVAFFSAERIPLEWQSVYLLSTLLVFRSAYTVVDVPHNAMLVLMSGDSRERTNIASWRIFFSSVGRIGVTLAATYFLQDSGTESSAARFTNASLLFATGYVTILALCLRAVSPIAIGLPKSTAGLLVAAQNVVRFVWWNRQLLIVFGITALTSMTLPVLSIAVLYFAKYALLDVKLASTALLLLACVQAGSPYFWSKLSNRLARKKHASQIANGFLAAVGSVFMLALHTSGSLFVLAVLVGFAIGGIQMLNWSMLPDAMNSMTAHDEQHHELSVFGLYTLTNKVCMGCAQAIAGVVLALFGYQANSDITLDTIDAIVATLIAFPVAGSIGCIWLLRYQTLRQ